jgi:hypothetical protein
MLDKPWPMNSWLLSMRWSDLIATERAIATASVSARMAMMVAGNRVCLIAPSEKSGIDSGGNEATSAPTVLMPVCSTPKRALRKAATRLPITMAMIM